MSEHAMQPPEPVIPEYSQHDRAVRKSRVVWIDKDEAKKLYTCRAALGDCVRALETAEQFIANGIELGYIKMPDVTTDSAHETLPAINAAIANARKALGE